MSTSSPTAVNSRPPVRHRQDHDRMSEPGMGKKRLWALLAVIVSCVIPHGLAAETLQIKSPLPAMREVDGQSIAYSTTGASSHITVLRFISEYGLKAKPVATGDVPSTITQVMSGQVDIGWSVAPFVLDLLSTSAARMIARASDIAAIREQTIRVQITSASNLAAKKDAIARYMKAYNETVDWMYSSPDAVPRYLAFSGLAEPAVRLMLREFIPRESLQTEKIMGLGESMKDAVQFKFLSTPLSDVQLKELIQVPAGS